MKFVFGWHFLIGIWLFVFIGCTDANVNVTLGGSSSGGSQFLAPTLTLASGTTPANNNTPTLTASGISSGDQVAIYSDASCSTKIVSATATSSSVNLTITPSLSSEGVYNYYAKRVNGTQASSCSATPLTYQYLALNVSALYPSNGSKWNDYVANDNGGDRFLASDAACSPSSSAIHSQCIHGGEKRVVTIFGSSSCSGLTMQDQLQAFDWQCVVIGGVAKFISRGLRSNKGVADLLNTATPAWKANSVTLYVNGAPTAVGNSSTWYSNSVGSLSSGLVLGTASKVYTINSDLMTSGHIVTASKVTVAIPKGLRLIYNGTANNCNAQGGAATPTGTCLFGVSTSLNYTWIEGSLQGTDGTNTVQNGIFLYANYLTHLRNIFISNVSSNAITMVSANGTLVSGLRTSQVGSGISTSSSSYDVFHDLTISNAYNAAKAGIYLSGGSSYNFIVRANLTGNSGYGYYGSGSYYSTLSHVNVYGNALDGIYTAGTGYYNGFNQIASAGNGGYGFNFAVNCESVMSNLFAIQNNGAYSIYDSTCGSSKYTGALLVTASTCSAGGTAGITNACVKTGASTAIRTTPSSPSFVGAATKDGFNPNTNITALSSISYLLGWTFFENFYRTWTNNNSSWPFTNFGACTSGSCNWWDFSLSASDTALRSKLGTFTAGAACPVSVGTGADANTLNYFYGSGSTTYFLANALEVFGSRYGNDNGLCDANEECIFTSNLGAYQGLYNPNASSQTCSYSNTTVPNVTLSNAYELTFLDSTNSSTNIALSAPNQPPTLSNVMIYNSTTNVGSAVGNLSFSKSSGKHYFEVSVSSLTGTAAGVGVGTSASVASINQAIGSQTGSFGYLASGALMAQGSSQGSGLSFTTGDEIGVAVDAGAGKLWFSKNGVWLSGNPGTGADPTFSGLPSGLVPMGSLGCSGSGCQLDFNFGQNLFHYPVPSGFNAGWYQ